MDREARRRHPPHHPAQLVHVRVNHDPRPARTLLRHHAPRAVIPDRRRRQRPHLADHDRPHRLLRPGRSRRIRKPLQQVNRRVLFTLRHRPHLTRRHTRNSHQTDRNAPQPSPTHSQSLHGQTLPSPPPPIGRHSIPTHDLPSKGTFPADHDLRSERTAAPTDPNLSQGRIASPGIDPQRNAWLSFRGEAEEHRIPSFITERSDANPHPTSSARTSASHSASSGPRPLSRPARRYQ